jgi:hypothetical protein
MLLSEFAMVGKPDAPRYYVWIIYSNVAYSLCILTKIQPKTHASQQEEHAIQSMHAE